MDYGKKVGLDLSMRLTRGEMIKLVEEKVGVKSISSVIMRDYLDSAGFIARHGSDFSPLVLEEKIINFHRDLRERDIIRGLGSNVVAIKKRNTEPTSEQMLSFGIKKGRADEDGFYASDPLIGSKKKIVRIIEQIRDKGRPLYFKLEQKILLKKPNTDVTKSFTAGVYEKYASDGENTVKMTRERIGLEDAGEVSKHVDSAIDRLMGSRNGTSEHGESGFWISKYGMLEILVWVERDPPKVGC